MHFNVASLPRDLVVVVVKGAKECAMKEWRR
jgi:hypothetical protein